MLTIAGGIILALFILWLLKWMFFGSYIFYKFSTGDCTPEQISAIEAQKAECERLIKATTVDASSVLLQRLPKEDRGASSDSFPENFALPSYDPDWKPTGR
jgi:hypothetical protein